MSQLRELRHDEEAMIPGRIVPKVLLDELVDEACLVGLVDERQLAGPRAKVLEQPLAMRPGVQVLAVERQLPLAEVELALLRVQQHAALLVVGGAHKRRNRRRLVGRRVAERRRTDALRARASMVPHLVVLRILGRQLVDERVEFVDEVAAACTCVRACVCVHVYVSVPNSPLCSRARAGNVTT